MKSIYFLLLIVILGMSEKTFAQSRWVGIMPMEFNPSFAGNAGGHRIVAMGGYTSSKEGLGKSYNGFHNYFSKERAPILGFSYDNFISKLATGIGFFASGVNSDQKSYFSDSHFSGLKTGIVISPKISINGKYTIAPSVGLTYKYLQGVYHSHHLDDTYKFKYDALNLSAGLLFNTGKFYIGYSYYFSPFKGKDTYVSYEDNKQVKLPTNKVYGLIQTGYKYQLYKESKTSYTLQAVVRVDGNIEWLDLVNNLSLTMKYKKILFGAATAEGFKNLFKDAPTQDALYAGIGYQTSKFKIFYSQDLTNLKFRYRGELSCRLFLPNKSKAISQF